MMCEKYYSRVLFSFAYEPHRRHDRRARLRTEQVLSISLLCILWLKQGYSCSNIVHKLSGLHEHLETQDFKYLRTIFEKYN
jgi:hypothetical protein